MRMLLERQAQRDDDYREQMRIFQERQTERDQKLDAMLSNITSTLDNLTEQNISRRTQTMQLHNTGWLQGPPAFSIDDTSPSLRGKSRSKHSAGSFPQIKSTPSKAQVKAAAKKDAYYRQLFGDNEQLFKKRPLHSILGMLSEEVREKWMHYSNTNEDRRLLEQVVSQYRQRICELAASEGEINVGSEPYYQRNTGALFDAIRVVLEDNGVQPLLAWHDTHDSPLRNDRKPDGTLIELANASDSKDWRWVAAVVEIKDDKASENNKVARGQILEDFLDMARDQPRKNMLGLGITKHGKVTAYVSTCDSIDYAIVGKLPALDTNVSSEEYAMVRFIAVLLRYLDPRHSYVVSQTSGIFNDINLVELVPPPKQIVNMLSGSFREFRLKIADDKAFSGRRYYIHGMRTWLYHAQIYYATEAGKVERGDDVILKLQWHASDAREGDIHKKANSMSVPHIPQLVFAGDIEMEEHPGGWEVLVMHNAGASIKDHAIWSNFHNACVIVDAFAGFSHTLLAASAGDGSGFILHRDVSASNLLMHGKDHEPRVIDWGYGLVASAQNLNRTTGLPAIVGTAPYMSLRVLYGQFKRSVVDDLESLFLVLSYCLCKHYGKPDKDWYRRMWSGTLSTSNLLMERKDWLESLATYIAKMNLNSCPRELSELAVDMYMALFGSKEYSASDIINSEADPRCSYLTNAIWAEIFSKSLEIMELPHVKKLLRFAKDSERDSFAEVDMDED
ncbi:hypothetical protein BX667DRAFT_496999 [Coemansia mojavensis]|nr:hypothetical protein BX667DRAFT_496999 [Coemansia mojavensis]